MGGQAQVVHIQVIGDALLAPTTGSAPPAPDADCPHGAALGLQSGAISDGALTASSQWDHNHGPRRARLNLKRSGNYKGSWVAKTNDVGQWLQVDLGKATKVSKIATQGRDDANQWVKSYWVSFSVDGGYYTEYAPGGSRKVTKKKGWDRQSEYFFRTTR